MNLKDRIAVFDRDSKLLEEIASAYSQDSEHHRALRRATKALWYVLREGHDFQQEFGAPDASEAPKKRPGEAGRDSGFRLDAGA